MKKITRWRPDTCGCIIEYEWDDSEAEDSRTHTLRSESSIPCAIHAADGEELMNVVLTENQTKNQVRQSLLHEAASLRKNDAEFRDGVEFQYSFNENRQLVVDLVGATALEKVAMRNVIQKFGNKVLPKNQYNE